ncbi:MAG TPA: polysaccharide deacetylase family protein, partial [Acetobacteraceae bacterium]
HASQPDMVNTSWRDYGNRVGGFRLLDRLSSLGIRPAILLNSAIYDHAPALIDAARAAGAEIVAHGHSNSDTLATMPAAEEAAYLRGVRDRIASHEGAPPRGWSSPWLAHSQATIDLLAEQGFSYLLDLRMDDQPVWLRTEGNRLLALPYALELNDSSTIIGRQTTARGFADMIIDEFDEMREAARNQPLVMSIVVHSFISGQPFRLRALTRALNHIAVARDDIWLATPGEIAGFIAANPHLAV